VQTANLGREKEVSLEAGVRLQYSQIPPHPFMMPSKYVRSGPVCLTYICSAFASMQFAKITAGKYRSFAWE